MLWKWQSRQRFNQHCDGLGGQTVAIRPNAALQQIDSYTYIRASGSTRKGDEFKSQR
jgi:hypothetical protein